MSSYEDYDTVAKTYDNGRIADGVDVMTNVLCGMLKKNSSEIHLLEAGCGTGNFSLAFLQHGIGKLTMIDGSQGMLSKAKEKTHKYADHVEGIEQAILPNIPYPDETFDAVAFVQVMHHLDRHHLKEDEELTYPVLSATLSEAYRVLKSGGALLIDHSFKENMNGCPIALAPKALELVHRAWPDESILIEKIKGAKFVNTFFIVRPNSTIFPEHIANSFEIVLDAKWREIDSVWKMAERTGELEPLVSRLHDMKKNGTLEKFAYDFLRTKRTIGEHNVIFAVKP